MVLFTVSRVSFASQSAQPRDSLPLTNTLSMYLAMVDSMLIKEDSAFYSRLLGKYDSADTRNVSVAAGLQRSFKGGFDPGGRAGPDKPHNGNRFFNVSGGFSSYAMSYRSVIDTPYAEKDILQHHLNGQINFTAAGMPLRATYLIRRSNSFFFRNIQDLQVAFDPAGARMLLQRKFQQQLTSMADSMANALMPSPPELNGQGLKRIEEWLRHPFQMQRLVEANEVLKVSGITYQQGRSVEYNRAREDSLQRQAAKFLALYHQIDSIHYLAAHCQDSLQNSYQSLQTRVKQFRQLSRSDFSSYSDYLDWKSEMEANGFTAVPISKWHEHLLRIRNFSLGRSPLQYSELTAKNISVNGLNLEYSSWYYAALAAGLVDFRFRDFAIGRDKRKQYLVLARMGIGQPERNFFVLSAFRGHKQLFTARPGATGTTGIDVNGYSALARWRINAHTSVSGEVAESISPDFRSADLQTKTSLQFKDFTNKAFSVQLSSYHPLGRSRLQAAYTYMGPNYQSFSTFQTNSERNAWYVKADRYFFKKMIRVSGSIQTSDFSNPFVTRNYKSNSVFKNVSVTFRKRKWPSFSVGYIPMSQLTRNGEEVSENRFQSLNANMYHYYKVGATNTASTVMFNKFYNAGSDTGYLYYNASSVYFAQNIFLDNVTANLSVSDTRNHQYHMQVFDESLQFKLTQASSFTLGLKINNMNGMEVKVGGYASGTLRLWKRDALHFSVERGFLPGYSGGFNRNDMGMIRFTRFFGNNLHYSSTNIL